MSARLYMFRGSEADNDVGVSYAGDDRRRLPGDRPFFVGETIPEPISDDEREELADATGWPTTRRFARSVHGSDAAFPASPEYADPVQRFDRALTWFDARWPLWFAIAACIGLVLALLKKAGWL